MIFGPYTGVVDLVHDGDTVNVKLDLGFDLTVYARVRIFGINAPELSTVEGKEALGFAVATLLVGTRVTVLSHGWDKYGGRVDGEVHLADGRNFADIMVDAGHAVRRGY